MNTFRSPPPNKTPHDDEISLWEIFETLRGRWRIVAVSTLGTPLLALAVGLAWPKQYEAIALVQVARIGNLQAAISGGGALTSAVESNASAIQRLQSDAFETRLSRALRAPVRIKATEPKGTGLISLVVRAPTLALAEEATTLALRLLAEDHAKQAKDAVASLKQSLEFTKQESSRITALLEDLLVETNQATRPDPTVTLMLRQMQTQLLTRQNALSERQLLLEVALSPLNTNQTQAVEAIVGSKDPVVPRLLPMVLFGLVGGGVLGVLIALTQQAWQSRCAVTKTD